MSPRPDKALSQPRQPIGARRHSRTSYLRPWLSALAALSLAACAGGEAAIPAETITLDPLLVAIDNTAGRVDFQLKVQNGYRVPIRELSIHLVPIGVSGSPIIGANLEIRTLRPIPSHESAGPIAASASAPSAPIKCVALWQVRVALADHSIHFYANEGALALVKGSREGLCRAVHGMG